MEFCAQKFKLENLHMEFCAQKFNLENLHVEFWRENSNSKTSYRIFAQKFKKDFEF